MKLVQPHLKMVCTSRDVFHTTRARELVQGTTRVVPYGELPPNIVIETLKMIPRAFLSRLNKFFELNVQDANTIANSFPSPTLFHKIVPTPYGEAYQFLSWHHSEPIHLQAFCSSSSTNPFISFATSF